MVESLFAMLMAGPLGLIGGGVLLYFFIKQRKAQEEVAPPLDLIDGKKLDAMVEDQVKKALQPILQSEGYSQHEIESILTRTSSNTPRFKR